MYKPHDDRLNLWIESYGGRFGPSFFEFFQQQNEKIRNGTIREKGTKYIHLDTLGILNGAIDPEAQLLAYADFAHNNVGFLSSVALNVYWKLGTRLVDHPSSR